VQIIKLSCKPPDVLYEVYLKEYDCAVRLHDLKWLSVSVCHLVSSNKPSTNFDAPIYAVFVNMGRFLIRPCEHGLEILWDLMHHCREYETNAWTLPRIMSRSFLFEPFSNLFLSVMTSFNPLQSLDANSVVTYKKCIFHVTLHNICSRRTLRNYQWQTVVLDIHNWSWLEKPCDISQKLQLCKYEYSEILKDDSSCNSVTMLTQLNLKIKNSCYYGPLHLMRVLVL